MTATLDLVEETLNDIGGANGLPVWLREGVESQAGLLVAVEALDGGGIQLGVLGDESGRDLIGLLAIGLVEDGFEFGLDLSELALRNVAQDVVELVYPLRIPAPVLLHKT